MTDRKDVYLIGTEEGTLFRCYVEPVGQHAAPHWIFDSARMRYVGPAAESATSLDQVEAIVHGWWDLERGDRQGQR